MSIQTKHIMSAFEGLSFSNEELSILKSILILEHHKKGTIIMNAGDIVSQMYYVFSGCLRTFCIDDQGREHTFQFAIKDWWITDFTAFFKSREAFMNLEVLQDATVIKLSTENRLLMINEIPQIHTYTRQKLENAYSSLQMRVLSSLSQSAKERYKDFLEMHPNIEKKVKNYHIASYLGITTESLSRIRKELSKK